MSNTRRPNTQRKHTRATETKRRDALETGIRITLDGTNYHTVRLGDVSSTIARELRRESGMSMQQLMGEITSSPDVDVVAAFVWVARRIEGEHIALEDVVVTYRDLLGDGFDVDLPDEEERGHPEA